MDGTNIWELSRGEVVATLEGTLGSPCYDDHSDDDLKASLIESIGDELVNHLWPAKDAERGKACHRYYWEHGDWPLDKYLDFVGTYADRQAASVELYKTKNLGFDPPDDDFDGDKYLESVDGTLVEIEEGRLKGQFDLWY